MIAPGAHDGGHGRTAPPASSPISTPPIRCSEILDHEEDFDCLNEDTDGTTTNAPPGLWTSSTSSAWTGLYEVSGGVAGGPHAAFADDAAERTLGRIVYRRGETSEVMASIDLEFSSKHYDAPWDFWGWGSDITFFGLHQGWAVSLLGWLDTVAIIVSAGIIRWRMVHRLRRVAPIVPSDGANDEKKALVSSGGKPFDGGSVGKGSATLSATSISSLVGCAARRPASRPPRPRHAVRGAL